MSRIITSVAIIIAVAAVAVGATTAYFTSSDTTSNNTFTAGTLEISLDQTMQTISPVISNWAPGQETSVRFNVDNTGSLPVHLRAFALGSWNEAALDDDMVKVIKAEYYKESSSSWVTIKSDSNGLADYIYYSPDGTDSALWELAGGATEQIKLSVLFDSAADNAYQGKTYTAAITVEAKQTNAPSW